LWHPKCDISFAHVALSKKVAILGWLDNRLFFPCGGSQHRYLIYISLDIYGSQRVTKKFLINFSSSMRKLICTNNKFSFTIILNGMKEDLNYYPWDIKDWRNKNYFDIQSYLRLCFKNDTKNY
jgi:hypothetical protein